MKRLASLLAVSIISVVLTFTAAYFIFGVKPAGEIRTHAADQQYTASVQYTSQTVASAPQNLPDFTEAAGMTVHAVVHVKTEYRRKSSIYEYFFDWRDFFGEPGNQDPVYQGSGSGVIISRDGFIVTNNHVIEGADRIEVTLNDKRTYDAVLIGTDPSTDIALIRIEESDLPFVNFGNSDVVRVGEWVLAVGNPFNLTSTVTAGIVSAKARNINILRTNEVSSPSAIESFIQTDAVVNRGNSGGALINTSGELIGINTAIASTTGYYAGYSFAIPANIVRKVTADLIEFGEIQRAIIGVQIRDIDSQLAKQLGLDRISGVYVAGLTENGSAREAGIKEGDIIIGIDNLPVNSTSELLEIIGQRRPGDEVIVAVTRDQHEKFYPVTLTNAKGTTDLVKKSEKSVKSLLGATFENLSAEDMERLDITNGVKVAQLESGKLMSAGIREGFIITRVDKRPVNDVDDIENALGNVSGGVLIEGIYPNGLRAYYGIGF